MQPFYHEGQVQAGGETLTLVCDFGAIMAIEGMTGENWDEIVPKLMNPSRSLSTTVLWGLLRRKHEGVTIDEAAGVAFGPDQAAVGMMMFDVIRRACNLDDGSEAETDEKKKRPGQSRSSAKNG